MGRGRCWEGGEGVWNVLSSLGSGGGVASLRREEDEQRVDFG